MDLSSTVPWGDSKASPSSAVVCRLQFSRPSEGGGGEGVGSPRTGMRRVCCWCSKDLGEKVPLEMDGVTGGACDPCASTMLGDIRRETGWAYHVVVSRACAHLFDEVSRLLRPWPHVKVLVDRRYMPSTHATPPPLYAGLGRTFAVPPRPWRAR